MHVGNFNGFGFDKAKTNCCTSIKLKIKINKKN